jgi:hypothetical protein
VTATDGEIVGGRYTPSRRDGQLPAQRSTVEVRGATAGVTVGPDQVLVLTFPPHVDRHELEQLRGRLLDSDLRPGQILLVAGHIQVAVVPAAEPTPAGPADTSEPPALQSGPWKQERCDSCRAAIIWAATAAGRRMPVDAHVDRDAGNIGLVGVDPLELPRAVIYGKAEAARRRLVGEPLRTSHFATCPDADRHRANRKEHP